MHQRDFFPKIKTSDNQPYISRYTKTSENLEYEKKPNKALRARSKPKTKIRVGSLFSGIGGFEKALDLLNIQTDIKFAVDNDKNVKKFYFQNHDIRPDDWYDCADDFSSSHAKKFRGQIDLLVGGPPCQPFSLAFGANKSKGVRDDRSNLIFTYTEILKKCKPSFFIFENVKSLVSIHEGRLWDQLIYQMKSAGYDNLYWDVLNAKDYGVPQSRQRIYLIGFKNSEIKYKFPQILPLSVTLRDLLEKKDVSSKYFLTKKGVEFVTKQINTQKKRTQVTHMSNSKKNIALCQTARQLSNWHGDFIEVGKNKYETSYDGYMARYSLSDSVQDFVLKPGSRNYHAAPKLDQEVAKTILSTSHKMHRAGIDNYIKLKDNKYLSNRKIRKLTPRECMNLMGWINRNYNPIKFKRSDISDTEIYRQTGNSVVVWVVAHILALVPYNEL